MDHIIKYKILNSEIKIQNVTEKFIYNYLY